MLEFCVGQVVVSNAGRDKGRYMLVIKIIDEHYVLVADGDLRTIENPKKKKIKHLQRLNKRSDYIAEKLKRGQKIQDNEVRRVLRELINVKSDMHALEQTNIRRRMRP